MRLRLRGSQRSIPGGATTAAGAALILLTLLGGCSADPAGVNYDPPVRPTPQPPPPLPPPPTFPQIGRIEGRVVFESNRDGTSGIYITTSESLTVKRIATGESPAISPDGSQVAFRRRVAYNNSELWIVDADGSNERLLGFGEEPSWSPEGKRLVFASMATDGGIFTINADGTNRVRILAHSFEKRDNWVNWPAWSPDGRRVAFTHGVPYASYEPVAICLMNADGSNVRRLVTSPSTSYWEEHAVWSPDGARIAFVTAMIGSFNVVSVDTAGLDMRLHASGFGADWSPDGRMVSYYRHTTFASTEDIPRFRIFATGADRYERQLIPEAPSAVVTPYSDLNPRWSRKAAPTVPGARIR